MSSHFSANQYNDAFKATRLGNWSYGINHPGSRPRARCGYTIPIADSRGHLLPGIERDPYSSPWGSYRTWIWEDSTKCDCADRLRRPEEYGNLPCNILVARERRFPTTEAKATADACRAYMFEPQPQRLSADSCEPEIQQAGEAQQPNEGKTQEILDRFDSYLEKN